MLIKKNIEALMDKRSQFYNSSNVNVLLEITNFKEVEQNPKRPFVKPLNTWDFDKELYHYFDICLEKMIFDFEKRLDIEDDYLPAITPHFGIAEHTAFLGGTVVFSADTSYHNHIINDYEDFLYIDLDENNKWLQYVIKGFDYYNEKAGGQILVALRGGCSPTEFLGFIRGNDLYTDLYDCPEKVHEALNFCLKAERFFIDHQRKHVPKFCGGTMAGMNYWLPGDSFGHLSEDWSVMCSKEMYEEFGKPYTEQISEGFDHVFMHVHSVGSHVIPNISDITSLTHIQISNDPNSKKAIDVYKEYSDCLKGKYVSLQISMSEILENVDFLKDRKTILRVENIESLDEGKSIVEQVNMLFDK